MIFISQDLKHEAGEGLRLTTSILINLPVVSGRGFTSHRVNDWSVLATYRFTNKIFKAS